MHIAIDAHSVGTGLAGNETYAVNLVEALAALDSRNRYTLYVTRPEAVARWRNRWRNFAVRRTLPHTPLIRIPLTLELELRRRPVDVLHVQFTAPPFAPCPVVVSIHDLSFEHLPETFTRRSRAQLRLTVRRTVRRAAQIITISEFTRRDLIDTYGIAPELITVTPLAAAAHFRPVEERAELARVRRTYGIAGEYILAVGSVQPRKNLLRLIRAYEMLRAEHDGKGFPQLVLVGKRAWLYGEILSAIERSPFAAQIISTGYVPNDDLPALYAGALCFAYPSVFEGFGLPPLEAMACGAAVVTGDRTSLPEVVGDAGLTVDPFDEAALATAIGRVLNDSDLRAALRVKGLQRAQEFSWERTAAMTLDVYRQATGN